MIVYVDSSAVLRFLFSQQGAYHKFGTWKEAASSELLFVECNRTIYRLRLENKISDETLSEYQSAFAEFCASISIISLNTAIIEKASSFFPTIIGSLDAIHLASAFLWKEEMRHDVYMLTHDSQLAIASKAMGIKVLGT